MDITIFKKLNLSDKEIKVYLTLLEYGAISVRSLSELANLNRGTAYDILKSLQEKGLATYFHHETKQKFVAEEPEKLIKLVADQEEELAKIKNNFQEIIPELKALQDKGESMPTAKFYESKSGIQTILNDVLESMKNYSGNEYYVYSAAGITKDLYQGYKDFSKKRIKSKIKVKTVSLSPGGETRGLDERKWIKSDQYNEENKTYIIIYADKCAFISRDAKGTPVGVIIENQMIYDTQKIIFLRLWGLLK